VTDERGQEIRLLVGECVTRVIDHRERGVRVVATRSAAAAYPTVESSRPATSSVGPTYDGP
jgi:hypothetical protein